MTSLRHLCPIYINTLNIFRPFKTWFSNVLNCWSIAPHRLKIGGFLKRKDFDWLEKNFYTWYWWDHPHIWNFKKKWIVIIFEDVQYKYKMGIREMETCPFILIRMFGWNLLLTLNDRDYQFWESQYTK